MRLLPTLVLLPALLLGGASGAVSPVAAIVRDGEWRWPVDVPRQVIRPFLAPPVEWGAGHRGVDLAAGTTLLAPADGIGAVLRYAPTLHDAAG